MKTLLSAVALTAFFIIAYFGCAENSDQAVNPVNENVVGILNKENLNSVTGSAHWRSVPVTGETNVRFSFNAIMHIDSTITGNVISRDDGPMMFGKARVYDLKVDGNIAKLSFQYWEGNLGDFYGVDITSIFGWLVVIDNGEGVNGNGSDLCSMILFTDGSDVSPQTIESLNAMSPEEYLQIMQTYFLPIWGIPYDVFLSPPDNGSIQVR
jgi:hypothetical protein